MSRNGFGFSFGNEDDDDDRRRDDQSPFGMFFSGGSGDDPKFVSGGLGDMLNQFGQMLSDMGSSMNDPNSEGPVNYSLAERIARQAAGSPGPVRANDAEAVRESVRLAELWLDDATQLPTSEASVQAWNAHDWLEHTLPMWKRFVTPVAEQMNEAQFDNVPEEAKEMIAPMRGMLSRMSSMNFGMQLGNALGELATQALTGSDFGLPVAPRDTTAVLPQNLQTMSKDLGVPAQEALVYLCAREAARQRLFKHVPWLVERLVSSVEEYAAGLVIDTSNVEEAMREIQTEAQDPEGIQEAMARLQGMDLSPTVTSRNAAAVSRLETMLALVEGWVELVVTEAMGDRVPSTAAMNEAWRRRRATGGSAEKAFAKVVGIEFAAPKVAEAQELWRRVETAVGIERRDAVWDHPDFLPVAEDLDNSAEFIDGLLDSEDSGDFDPIAEIAKLEEELAREAENTDSGAADADAKDADAKDADAQDSDDKDEDDKDSGRDA
ncbi:zinc-dependent metalloprotease [Corynebacterium sp. TAE3-ERU2]|uniref:zinc-dependent metalloprotease n=1 Tax=Corynebacterium sp. TAE3-ERU2 TaxID=2849497 RepID=UPI001C445F84|nr:zinc-dependent metalloprotease [Corynebacterium sp. TAE3-ERU2]MBV7302882.1 zinc-dependent metalloprotease [Corynebacterium sp. TAE3-ERU2]